MTEYYDEAYFCIWKDHVVWAQHCGEHGQVIDLGGVILQPTINLPPTNPIPEASTSLMMGMGLLAVVVYCRWKARNQ
jgi:hypothetical protein